jgi:hypothetical protein
MAIIKVKLDALLSQVSKLERDMDSRFAAAADLAQLRKEFSDLVSTSVTQDQFWPIKTAVYGAIGLVLVGALGSILALIYRSSS